MFFLTKSTVRRLAVVNLIFLLLKKEVNYCWPLYCCDLANNNIDIVTPNVVLKFIFWGSRNTLLMLQKQMKTELYVERVYRSNSRFDGDRNQVGCGGVGSRSLLGMRIAVKLVVHVVVPCTYMKTRFYQLFV